MTNSVLLKINVVKWGDSPEELLQSFKDFDEVTVSIDRWIASTKHRSILRVKTKHTIEHTQFIYWN